MTKKELIEALESYDDDMEVIIPANGDFCMSIKDIDRIWVKKVTQFNEVFYQRLGWIPEGDKEVISLN